MQAGTSRQYEVEVKFVRNLGCKPGTSECEHVNTAWAKGGQRGGAVTLVNQHKDHVDVRVAAGTAAGTFTLRATPEVTCKCKGPTDITRPCTMQFDEVTISVEV